MKDNRVDPSDKNDYAIKYTSSDINNYVIKTPIEKRLYKKIVKELLKNERVNPLSIWGYIPYFGYSKIRKFLIDKRIDPSFDNNWPIKWASRRGDQELIKELIKNDKFNLSINNNELIKLAKENNHIETIILLKNIKIYLRKKKLNKICKLIKF